MGISRKLVSWLGITALALTLLVGALVLSPVTGARASDSGEGWLGVSLQELTPRLRDAMDLDPDTRGAVVATVFRGSPAADAGLREGDVIIELNDERVRSVDEAVDLVQGLTPGEKILVVVVRDGEQRGLGATLGTRNERGRSYFVPDSDAEVRKHYGDDPRDDPRRAPRANDQWAEEDDRDAPENDWRSKGDDRDRDRNRIHVSPRVHSRGASGGYLGVRTMPLGEQLAEYFDVDGGEGVLITEVVEDSPAAEAGLMAGDVIVRVGNSEVESPGELRQLVRKHDPEDSVEITVLRKGSRKTLNVTLGEAGDFGNVFILDGDDHMVAMPDMPDFEIIMPNLESLDRLHLDLEALEDLEVLEKLELEGLPDMEIILDKHHDGMIHLKKNMKHLHKNMEHLRHNLREIHQRELHQRHKELKQVRDVEREVRRELRRVEREQRVRSMEARQQARERLQKVEALPRTGKTV